LTSHRYTQIRKRGKGKKVYLRMVTTLGNLSIMLHFDIVSRVLSAGFDPLLFDVSSAAVWCAFRCPL
jgi:hypothetical protein